MSIPFNSNLGWENYKSNPDWHPSLPTAKPEPIDSSPLKRTVHALFVQTIKESVARTIQFVRDAVRLVLKVPIRAIRTPIILSKNWKELERAKVNVKLTGYAFVQLLSVPAKFLVALAALATLVVSAKQAQKLLTASDKWTAHLDGRAAQLEALKEEGRVCAQDPTEYKAYKAWLYSIDPILCRGVGD